MEFSPPRDESGRSLHTTELGTAPTVGTGKVSSALTYGGQANSGAEVGPSNIIGTGLTAMTLECWFKTTTALTNQLMIAARDYSGATGSNNYEMRLHSGKVMCGFYCATGYKELTSLSSYNDANWHHAAGTYDGANVRLYVDGAEVTNQALAGGAVNSGGGAKLRLGNYANSGAAFNGALDEMAIYATALSAVRVKAHYDAASQLTNDLWVWNGTTAVPANVTVWNGTAEVATSVSVT